jgi:NadR type nicotinamide-nucleotide adenylyltransferase
MPPIKKIVIIGPESTGKSTLTKALANKFGEPWVEEYARPYLENLDREYQYDDLLEIAKGQLELEDLREKSAKRMLFCDTNLFVIKVWSDHKFLKTEPWILEQLQKRRYDFYLLTHIDIPWEEDPLREHPEPSMRGYFYQQYLQIVRNSNVPFAVIQGNPEERLDRAIGAIKKITKT